MEECVQLAVLLTGSPIFLRLRDDLGNLWGKRKYDVDLLVVWQQGIPVCLGLGCKCNILWPG